MRERVLKVVQSREKRRTVSKRQEKSGKSSKSGRRVLKMVQSREKRRTVSKRCERCRKVVKVVEIIAKLRFASE